MTPDPDTNDPTELVLLSEEEIRERAIEIFVDAVTADPTDAAEADLEGINAERAAALALRAGGDS